MGITDSDSSVVIVNKKSFTYVVGQMAQEAIKKSQDKTCLGGFLINYVLSTGEKKLSKFKEWSVIPIVRYEYVHDAILQCLNQGVLKVADNISTILITV